MDVREITSSEAFYRIIQTGVCLVDFHAPWCAPCRAQEPILGDLARCFEGRAIICFLNIEAHPDLALAWTIEHVPTLILFREGQVLQRLWGLQSGTVLNNILSRRLGPQNRP